jgi:diketogulonate reductase-like aldo/keto reductase
VLYNLTRRDIESALLPACAEAGLPVMAYTPVTQGRVLGHPALGAVATRHGATPAQVALAWVLRIPGVCAIPGSGRPDHVRENRAALDLRLDREDLDELDRAFPAPGGPGQLRMS